MELKYCNTNEMIADYYTKQLQGKQFYKLRDMIMGIKSNDVLVKECVEERKREQKNEKRVTSTHIEPGDVKMRIKRSERDQIVAKVRQQCVEKRSNNCRSVVALSVGKMPYGQVCPYRVSNNFG